MKKAIILILIAVALSGCANYRPDAETANFILDIIDPQDYFR